MALEINAATFEEKINQDKPVIIDFFATWCGPCKMLAPVLEEVAADVADRAEVYKLDIDQAPDLAREYGVQSVPTVIVFQNGEEKTRSLGFRPKEQIIALLDV